MKNTIEELKKIKPLKLAELILQQKDLINKLKEEVEELKVEQSGTSHDTIFLGKDNKILSGDKIETYDKNTLDNGGDGYGY